MFTINIWLYTTEVGGHASASLGNSDKDKTYVSWWPKKDSWLRKSTGVAYDPDSDEAMLGPPSQVVQVPGLNEAAGRTWWELLQKDESFYRFPSQNSAWAVIACLKAAGADELVTSSTLKNNKPIWELTPRLAAQCGTRALKVYFDGSTGERIKWVDDCTDVWTSADVSRYAMAIPRARRVSGPPVG